jgi:hypothetical protein
MSTAFDRDLNDTTDQHRSGAVFFNRLRLHAVPVLRESDIRRRLHTERFCVREISKFQWLTP